MEIEKLFEPAVQKYIQENIDADIRQLALQAQGKFDLPLGFLMDQINGKQKAKKKLPSWFSNDQIVYPPDISMQQCSSEISAELKTKHLPKGNTCIDLGGGFGVDTYYLAQKFDKVIYVEQNEDLCQIVAHNFKAFGIDNVEVVNANGEEFIESYDSKVDLIFLDPARRDEQQNRIFQFEDCSPNIIALEELLLSKGENLLVKASPLIDITSAYSQFSAFKNCQVIGVNNECKEVMFSTIKNLPNLTCSHSNNGELEEYTFDDTGEVFNGFSKAQQGGYIYEPNVTIRKAQQQNQIAKQFDLGKLFKNGSLYFSTALKTDFPGRIFKLEQELTNKKQIQKLKNAEVISKNYPLVAAAFKKKYKLGASAKNFILAFTNYTDQKQVWLCSKEK
jgi:tRNA G46 methylase TrmB